MSFSTSVRTIFCPNCGRKFVLGYFANEKTVKGCCPTCRSVITSTKRTPKEYLIKVIAAN